VGVYRDSILGNFASRQYGYFIDRLIEIKTILSRRRLRAADGKQRVQCLLCRYGGAVRAQFFGFDYVVAPSGSCVHHVRDNFDAVEQTPQVKEVRARTFELVEFLHDIQKADAFPWARFPHRVGLHNSCGTLRALRHAKPSELNEPFFSKPMDLLSKVEGIEFVTPARPDECCGFGGTFSVFEEVVSTKMGYDKVSDHARAGAEYIVSADSSCLMHQQGCAERIGVPIKFIHIAQILNGAGA
jgi:L-lactate dehydrogenase complex protein LldE